MSDPADDILLGLNEPPPTDETGNVDLSLLWYTLSLTVAERIEQHYRARVSVEELRRAGERLYGRPAPDFEATER